MPNGASGEGLDFIYEISGPEQVDVFELAPALLSIGNLVRESNSTMHPGEADVGVNVRPFRPGSFVIDLYPAAQAGLPLIPRAAMATAQLVDVLKTIGLVAGLPANLLEAIRVLKGNPTRVEPVGPGKIKYSTGDGNVSITVNGDVHDLVQNSSVRDSVSRALKPLLSEDVTEITSYLKDQEEDSKVHLAKADAQSFREFGGALPPQFEHETETINEHIVSVHPKRGPYDGKGGRWYFWRGGFVQPATMKDEVFMDRCARGEIRLHASDLLRVRLLERQRVSGTDIHTTWEIPEVLEYRKGPSQRFLPGAEPES